MSAVEALRKLYEIYNNKTPPTNIKCKVGCAFCCYIPVECTKEGAELVLSLYKPESISHGDFKPCPFLDRKSKSCKVYNYRPLACRGYTSTSKTACERAHWKRNAKAKIPADGQTYWFYLNEAMKISGPRKKLTEWLEDACTMD